MSVDRPFLSEVSREDLLAIIGQLFVRLNALEQLLAENAMLRKENAALKERLTELEARISKDSHNNSSKPTSSDGLSKKPVPKSLRPVGDKPSGGQVGHTGRTLRMVDLPNHTRIYAPGACDRCGCDLTDVPDCGTERRQVFDLPVMAIETTEHVGLRKTCPDCGRCRNGTFP